MSDLHSFLKHRARLLARARAFFAERGVLEVETPILSRTGTTDPNLASFVTDFHGPGGGQFFLHTSPEFGMKRLLAAGSGDIYQICKVFRDGELGRLHHPEFTMVEWYRVGMTVRALEDETVLLIENLLGDRRPPADAERVTYREAFQRHADVDPFLDDVPRLKQRLVGAGHGVPVSLPEDDRDGWCDLVLTHRVEPHLGRGRLTVLCDYPASQAALARLKPDNPAVAERFEVYLDGVELANGFGELCDAVEQRARFERDLAARRLRGLTAVPMDEALLAALERGLPACSGVAVGFDRVVMLAEGGTTIGPAT